MTIRSECNYCINEALTIYSFLNDRSAAAMMALTTSLSCVIEVNPAS